MAEEYHFAEKIHGVLIMSMLEMVRLLVLIIVHHLIPTIEKITAYY